MQKVLICCRSTMKWLWSLLWTSVTEVESVWHICEQIRIGAKCYGGNFHGHRRNDFVKYNKITRYGRVVGFFYLAHESEDVEESYAIAVIHNLKVSHDKAEEDISFQLSGVESGSVHWSYRRLGEGQIQLGRQLAFLLDAGRSSSCINPVQKFNLLVRRALMVWSFGLTTLCRSRLT